MTPFVNRGIPGKRILITLRSLSPVSQTKSLQSSLQDEDFKLVSNFSNLRADAGASSQLSLQPAYFPRLFSVLTLSPSSALSTPSRSCTWGSVKWDTPQILTTAYKYALWGAGGIKENLALINMWVFRNSLKLPMSLGSMDPRHSDIQSMTTVLLRNKQKWRDWESQL